MKITTFDPMIATTNAGPVIEVFRELGFERTHTAEANDGLKDVERFRMKNCDGYHIDIAQIADLPQDITLIRMNVDDFEEAYQFFTEKGFTNLRSGSKVETKSNISAVLVSPSGFAINLIQHYRK